MSLSSPPTDLPPACYRLVAYPDDPAHLTVATLADAGFPRETDLSCLVFSDHRAAWMILGVIETLLVHMAVCGPDRAREFPLDRRFRAAGLARTEDCLTLEEEVHDWLAGLRDSGRLDAALAAVPRPK